MLSYISERERRCSFKINSKELTSFGIFVDTYTVKNNRVRPFNPGRTNVNERVLNIGDILFVHGRAESKNR